MWILLNRGLGRRRAWIGGVLGLALVFVVTIVVMASSGQAPRRRPGHPGPTKPHHPPQRVDPNHQLVVQGRQVFRYDTFGDEVFWGDKLRLHEAVATLSPKQALGLGLKVDSESLPPALRLQLRRGQVNLDDPATT
ncbi:MAG: hypothetical protein ABI353_12520, partial [Isosphaeraceae bacterium]